MFCPRCRVEYRPSFTTCATCGVSLVHDLPRDEPRVSSAETITVFGPATESEVAVAQSLLEEAAIPFMVHNDIGYAYSSATGWPDIKILVKDRERAREALAPLLDGPRLSPDEDGAAERGSDFETPPPEEPPPIRSGLDGLLLAVGALIAIVPLRFAYYSFAFAQEWRRGAHAAETAPGYATYHPVWLPSMIVFAAISALLLLGALALAWLFFRKKRAFPLAATVFGIVYLVADLADSLLWLFAVRPRYVDAGALVETFAENVPTGVVILAVVVYLRTSERVRATFVE